LKKKVKLQPLFVTATISVVYFTVFFQVRRNPVKLGKARSREALRNR